MEALMEREEGQVENWNDDRLDELSRRMDESFKETREEMRSGFKEMREGFDRLGREMKEGFERADERFFRFMVVVMAIGGGMISALIAAQF